MRTAGRFFLPAACLKLFESINVTSKSEQQRVDVMAIKGAVALTLAIASSSVSAQNPSNPGGFTNTDPRSPYYNSGNNLPPSVTSPRYQNRWGAIATGKNATLGTAVDMESERDAKRVALKACQDKGGVQCKLEIAYRNQCATLVTGDSVFNTSSAPTVEEAAEMGIAKCREADSNCRVYYSECSLPVRAQ